MRTVAVLVALAVPLPPAVAETTPPPFSFDGATPRPTLLAPPPVDLRLGQLRIRFGRTTLRDLQVATGKGIIAHRGDAGESKYWLCYEGTVNSSAVRLWFIAGEIDGPKRAIGVVQLVVATRNPYSEGDCPALPDKLQRISLGRATVLGLSAEGAVARLGEPSSRESEALSYFHLRKIPGQYQGTTVDFDRSNLLELRLVGGKVVGLVVSQSTTY